MGPPPSDEVKVITMRAIGGEVGAASTLAPKVSGASFCSFFLAAALLFYANSLRIDVVRNCQVNLYGLSLLCKGENVICRIYKWHLV